MSFAIVILRSEATKNLVVKKSLAAQGKLHDRRISPKAGSGGILSGALSRISFFPTAFVSS